jgi:hypothetical protein
MLRRTTTVPDTFHAAHRCSGDKNTVDQIDVASRCLASRSLGCLIWVKPTLRQGPSSRNAEARVPTIRNQQSGIAASCGNFNKFQHDEVSLDEVERIVL